MPRRRLPARLRLRKARSDRRSVWVIVDGETEVSTGVGTDDVEAAQETLEAYLAAKHRAPSGESDPRNLLVDEVVETYLREHAPSKRSSIWLAHTAEPLLQWWTGKPLSAVNGANCKMYVAWRTAQRVKSFTKQPGRFVSSQTARHELKTLRAAINYYHSEHGPLAAVPAVSLPDKSPPRSDYWWTRKEAAARLRAARSRPETRHLTRMILIGLYSGTRPGAIMRLRWLPSPEGGWIDIENRLLHRRGQGAVENKKRQPPAPLHKNLLLHMRRWRDADVAKGIGSVIHYQGEPITKVRKSWETVRKLSAHPRKDSPHVLRHTAATWFMQAGADVAQIAGYLGMSVRMLDDIYGHHHPDYMASVAQSTPGKRLTPVGRK
jgi:integrase